MPEDEPKEFDDGYDENLMGDEEDKKHLASLTEKEREQELFNRSERRETLKIRYEIEKKLKSKAKRREQEKKQSRKRFRVSEIFTSDEESSESDEYTPEVDSHTIETSTKNATKMNTRSTALNTSSSSSPSSDSASSESSSSESERENDGPDASEEGNQVQDDFQMTLADLRTLQLKRDQIDKWVYAPFFKETAIGLFAKMSVGNHPQTQEHMYKVAQIIDITKIGKVYTLNKHKTDKQCLVRIGRVERTYPMNFISNRSFDDDDYNRWKDQIHMDGQDMPSREHFNKKKRDLHRAINYEYKDEDIAYEVTERSRFNDHPFNFALKKTELLRDKAEAEGANDYERAAQLQKMVDDLEEKAKELEKTRSSSTFSAISYVNERNRYKNIVESERVLKESKSVKTEDPFTRRKCTPTIVHNKNNGDPNKSGTNDKNGQGDLSKTNSTTANTLNTSSASTNNNGNKSMSKQGESFGPVDDLFQAHASIDLEIDIDI